MSFNFGDSSINQFKAQAAYKDGGGMGGGGMYMKQNKKKKEDEDIFTFSAEESSENEISYDSEPEDIPQDTLVNKFVNWFRQGKK